MKLLLAFQFLCVRSSLPAEDEQQENQEENKEKVTKNVLAYTMNG
jgi:hypothetical protein